ncbi:MAG: hypothetical protein ACE5FU_14525, partial [Nitrospinota bacterium]
VKAAQKRWKAITQRRFSLESALVKEERGGKDRGLNARLTGPLTDYKYRLELLYGKRRSEAGAEEYDYSRLGAGFHFFKKRLVHVLERISYDPERGKHFGSYTSISYTPKDSLSFSGEVNTFSLDIPLRAKIAGVRGRSGSFSFTYAPDDRKKVKAGALVNSFSDRNIRSNFFVLSSYKVIPGGIYRSTLQLFGAASNNSKGGRTYFNPENDLTYSLTSVNDITLYNYNGRRFSQTISLEAGRYHQKNFSGEWIFSALYEQNWQFGNGKELSFGVHWARRVFDGNAEKTPRYFLRGTFPL